VIAYQVARHLEPDSLYSGWLRRRGEHIEHGAAQDVLSGLQVRDALDPAPALILESATVSELLLHLDRAGQTDFPVVDGEGRLLGMITVAELGRVARDNADLANLLVAADVAQPSVQVSPADSLREAVQRMGLRGAASLPVVDPATGVVTGIVTRAHILALYEATLARVQAPQGAAASRDPQI
jgi:chloride channel protein, CIC family